MVAEHAHRQEAETGNQEMVSEMLRAAAAYYNPETDAFWQKELAALQQLAALPKVKVEQIALAPVVLPDNIAAQCLPLVEGMNVRAWVQSEEPFSVLASIWIKAVGAVTSASLSGIVRKVHASDGLALLEIDPQEVKVPVREQKNHQDEHVDEGMFLLQANVDDASPEWLAYTMELLFQAGANDVTMLPATMKKSRAGVMIQVMCYQSDLSVMENILFQETTTFGVRYFPVACHRLGRRFLQVQTAYGEVLVKIGYLKGQRVQVSPEYDVCAKLAKESSVPLKQVYREAMELANRKAPLQL